MSNCLQWSNQKGTEKGWQIFQSTGKWHMIPTMGLSFISNQRSTESTYALPFMCLQNKPIVETRFDFVYFTSISEAPHKIKNKKFPS